MDKAAAVKATRNGAIAACISGAVTIIVVAVAIVSNSQGQLKLWNDPANIVDIVFIFACAFGVYKKSRTAAILLLFYFIVSRIVITIDTKNYVGIGLSLVFLYFFAKAAQGAYVFHKIEKSGNPDYRPAPKWMYYVGIPTSIIFVVLIFLGLLATTGVLPTTSAADQDLNNNLAALNKSLPRMVDKETRLDRIAVEGKDIVYSYTLVHWKTGNVDHAKFHTLVRQMMIPKVCSDDGTRPLLQEGRKLIYVYSGKDSKRIDRVVLGEADCPKA